MAVTIAATVLSVASATIVVTVITVVKAPIAVVSVVVAVAVTTTPERMTMAVVSSVKSVELRLTRYLMELFLLY